MLGHHYATSWKFQVPKVWMSFRAISAVRQSRDGLPLTLFKLARRSHNLWFAQVMVVFTRSIPMPKTTKQDEESEAKAQLERLVKDGDQIAKKLPPFIPQRRRGGLLSD